MLRVVETEWVAWRRLWKASVFQTIVTPLLFLAAMGLGLGDLVNKRSGGVDGFTYLEFIAPGLLAASAMMQAAAESLWPVLGHVKWQRTYHAAVATPVRAGDLFGGHVLWICLRCTFSATVFLVVGAILGGVPSAWGVLAIPAAVLGASVFAAALNAYAVTQESDIPFAVIMRVGLFPLFLFSGTFFPTSRLPDWLQPVSWLSPLWHAVELVPRRDHRFGAVGRHRARARDVPRRLPPRRVLVGRASLHPGVDVVIAAIAVRDAGRRRSGRGAWRIVERNTLAYRRMWLAFVTGLFEPLLYLLSIGIGVGGLVGKVAGPGGHLVPYDEFVAPGCWPRRR